MVFPNPSDTELSTWLRLLKPRQELTFRLALRGVDSACRADPVFSAWLDELLDILLPTDRELMTLLAEAHCWREKLSAWWRSGPASLALLRAILAEEDRFEH
jgi:hypothetical protein